MLYHSIKYAENRLSGQYIRKNNLSDSVEGVSMIRKALAKYQSLPLHAKVAFWYLVCSFLQKGISVLTTPIFTRLMSTEEYGKYSVFSSWQGIVAIFITLRLYYGVYGQGLVKFDKEKNIFSSSLQGLVLTMTLLWTVVYFIFHSFFNSLFSLTTLQVVMMLIMTWTEAAFSFWAAEQRIELNYKKLVILTLAVSFFEPTVGILLVNLAKDKVTARVVGLAAVELIGYTGLFISQMKRGKVFFSKKYWKYALAFNIPLIPHYLSQTVLNSSDRIMISRMVDESSAGVYSLAYSISMVMTLFVTALSHTIGPWLLQKIKAGRLKDTENIAYISLACIAAVNLLLIAFAPEAVAIFAPASYSDAIYVIPPVAMSVYFIFAYDIFSNVEFYFEKTKFIMIASLIAAVINIVLNYIFIPIFGYYAAGYTTLFCYTVYAVFHYAFMRRICKTQMGLNNIYSIKVLSLITGAFFALGFIYLFTYKFAVIRYIITLILVAIAFIKRKEVVSHIRLLIDKRAGKDSE